MNNEMNNNIKLIENDLKKVHVRENNFINVDYFQLNSKILTIYLNNNFVYEFDLFLSKNKKWIPGTIVHHIIPSEINVGICPFCQKDNEFNNECDALKWQINEVFKLILEHPKTRLRLLDRF